MKKKYQINEISKGNDRFGMRSARTIVVHTREGGCGHRWNHGDLWTTVRSISIPQQVVLRQQCVKTTMCIYSTSLVVCLVLSGR